MGFLNVVNGGQSKAVAASSNITVPKDGVNTLPKGSAEWKAYEEGAGRLENKVFGGGYPKGSVLTKCYMAGLRSRPKKVQAETTAQAAPKAESKGVKAVLQQQAAETEAPAAEDRPRQKRKGRKGKRKPVYTSELQAQFNFFTQLKDQDKMLELGEFSVGNTLQFFMELEAQMPGTRMIRVTGGADYAVCIKHRETGATVTLVALNGKIGIATPYEAADLPQSLDDALGLISALAKTRKHA